MIRSWEEAREKGLKALEQVSTLLIFGAGLLLSQLFAAVPPLRIAFPVVGFLLAVALPTLVYGRVDFRTKWQMLDEAVEDVAIVDLSRAPRPLGVPEVTFCVDLFLKTDSLWAALQKKRRKKQDAELWIEILPPESAELKLQKATGGARLEEEVETSGITRQFVVLTMTSTSETAAQSRFVGSIVPHAIVSKQEDLSVSATLRFRGKRAIKRKPIKGQKSAVRTIRIRS